VHRGLIKGEGRGRDEGEREQVFKQKSVP
jgi:hypothetical protein